MLKRLEEWEKNKANPQKPHQTMQKQATCDIIVRGNSKYRWNAAQSKDERDQEGGAARLSPK